MTRTRTSLVAVALGLSLLAPGSWAMVCAPGADCVQSASAEVTDRCSRMQKTEPESSIRPAPAGTMNCCVEPAEPAETQPALTLSTESIRVDQDLATPAASIPGTTIELLRTARSRTGPDTAVPPAESGRDRRTLHQSFLN